MRVLSREDFLNLPEGTFYCKGGEWYFNNINIKGPTWDHPDPEALSDWVYLDMNWPQGKDSEECFDILEKALVSKESFESNNSSGRDGSFDKEDLFLVYEKEDLLKLKTYIDEALTNEF